MNLTKLALMTIVLCGCVAIPLAASDNTPADEDAQTALKELKEEISVLRARIAELEAHLKRMEGAREIAPTAGSGLRKTYIPVVRQVFELEPQRSGLPLNGDKGLYVFPGIDAPPYTPMDVLRSRLSP